MLISSFSSLNIVMMCMCLSEPEPTHETSHKHTRFSHSRRSTTRAQSRHQQPVCFSESHRDAILILIVHSRKPPWVDPCARKSPASKSGSCFCAHTRERERCRWAIKSRARWYNYGTNPYASPCRIWIYTLLNANLAAEWAAVKSCKGLHIKNEFDTVNDCHHHRRRNTHAVMW